MVVWVQVSHHDGMVPSRPRGGVPRGSGTEILSVPGASEVQVISRQAIGASYAFALVAVVVVLDVLFFKHRFWERLAANIGIVLVFGAFYFRFLNRR